MVVYPGIQTDFYCLAHQSKRSFRFFFHLIFLGGKVIHGLVLVVMGLVNLKELNFQESFGYDQDKFLPFLQAFAGEEASCLFHTGYGADC